MYPEILMRVRGPLLALLALAGLAWVILGTRTESPSAAAPPPSRPGARLAVRQIADLDRATDRLQARLAAAPRTAAPSRNPFEFVVAKPPAPKRSEVAGAVAALAPLVLPPAPPAVTLVGLVDREVDGRMVRTAVLSFGGHLHYVEAGERLGAAYEVVAVGPNAVDLLALETNTPRRLVQR